MVILSADGDSNLLLQNKLVIVSIESLCANYALKSVPQNKMFMQIVCFSALVQGIGHGHAIALGHERGSV